MMKLNALRCSLVFLMFGSFACSARLHTDTVEVRNLLASLTSLYLSHLTLNNTRELKEMVFWGDYIENNPEISKKSFFEEVDLISKKWTPKNSPISNLSIISIETSDDRASVKMQQPVDPTGKSEIAEMSVEFAWVGSGWLVVDDSIMGKDGVIAKALSQNE